MSRRGLHTALAAAGVLLGLPLAAVLQWNRRFPAEVWSSVGCQIVGPGGYDSSILLGASHRFRTSPGGMRVTSIEPGASEFTLGSVHLRDVAQGPYALVRLLNNARGITPTRRGVFEVRRERVLIGGVTWYRLRMGDAK